MSSNFELKRNVSLIQTSWQASGRAPGGLVPKSQCHWWLATSSNAGKCATPSWHKLGCSQNTVSENFHKHLSGMRAFLDPGRTGLLLFHLGKQRTGTMISKQRYLDTRLRVVLVHLCRLLRSRMVALMKFMVPCQGWRNSAYKENHFKMDNQWVCM